MPSHPKPVVVKDPAWLKAVRGMPCRVADYRTCNFAFGRSGPNGERLCEPNHLRGRNDDSCVVPLCPGHHRTNTVSWHHGQDTFCGHYGVTKAELIREAEAAYKAYLDGGTNG